MSIPEKNLLEKIFCARLNNQYFTFMYMYIYLKKKEEKKENWCLDNGLNKRVTVEV